MPKKGLGLGDRISRLEGSVSEMGKRIDDMRNDISELRKDIRELRGRFWWVIGILIPMWVTIILAILFE